MKAAGRRIAGVLGRVVGCMDIVKRMPPRAVKAMSYTLIVGGIAVVAHGTLSSSLSVALGGVSFLALGLFSRTMMEKTKDISERLLDGQEEILKAIRGPPRVDGDGNPVKPDYAKENLMVKMDELNTNLTAKMDELIGAVNRMAERLP